MIASFDFGQTLAELDTEMLAAKCAARGVAVDPARADDAVFEAFRAYDRAISAGHGGHPWKLLVRTLLELAGARGELGPVVDHLWDDQPRRNLWRRPIPGMIELARELRAAGVPVVIVSNSEGRLAELVAEMGWAADFDAIADSGALGIEKPDRRIFDWAAARVGGRAEDLVHVGDSLAADVGGALAAGARAVWVKARPTTLAAPPGVPTCEDAAAVRAALVALGLAGGGSRPWPEPLGPAGEER